MIFVDDLKRGVDIALHPKREAGGKMTMGEAIRFYYKFSVIPTVLFIISSAIFANSASAFAMPLKYFASYGAVGAALLAAAMFWILEPLGMAIDAAIFHFFGKTVLKSFKNRYDATFTAMVYAILPALLLYWLTPIPIIGIAAIIAVVGWELIVLILALSRQQNVSAMRAVGVVLLATVVVLLIAVIVSVGVALGLRA
jgi:hypothetical protein